MPAILLLVGAMACGTAGDEAPPAEAEPPAAPGPPTTAPDPPPSRVPPVADISPDLPVGTRPASGRRAPPGETPVTSDQAAIAATVRRGQGGVQGCFEAALRVNPAVHGRVGVGWTIDAGTVRDARVVSDSTGEAALGRCIVGVVAGLRFDPEITAEVAEFPWVFEAIGG